NTFMWIADAPDMPAPDSAMVRIMIAASRMPRPEPPYSSGMQMPSQPASASALWKSAGKTPPLFFFSQNASSKRVQILLTASRIDSWLAVSAKSIGSILCCKRPGDAVVDHCRDLVGREAGLAENFLAMLVEPRREPRWLGRRLRPRSRHLHASDRPFGRMLDHGEIAGCDQMRIGQHAFEIVHRHHRNVGRGEQFRPLRGR